MKISDSTKTVVALGKLSLNFARTNRATYHEDGKTLESDTDHTFMLCLVGCAFASKFVPRLDVGKIVQYALVHDLVEVYAGDTPTIKISEEQRKDKENREAAALFQIEKEFNEIFPWIGSTIREYQSLNSPESRFVKAVDKLMPKITHIFNNAVYLKEQNISSDEIQEIHEREKMGMQQTYAADQPEVMELYDSLVKEMYSTIKK